MNLPQLTPNFIYKVFNQNDTTMKPVLQVMEVKRLGSGQNGAAERYRVIISDGVHFQQGMLATQLNDLVHSNILRPFCIIRLKEYVCNIVAQRRVIIMIELEMLHDGPGAVIGTPSSVDPSNKEVMGTVQSDDNGSAGGGGGWDQKPGLQPPPALQQHDQQQQHFQQQQQQQPFIKAEAPKPFGGGNNMSMNGGSSSFNMGGGMHGGGMGGGGGMGQHHGGMNGNMNGGPAQSSAYDMRGKAPANESFHPIASLHPYHNRWIIKARITNKSDIRRWSNQRGEGKLFSVDLLDNQGGEIRATMFNDAADKYFPVLQEGKVYTFSKGVLKIANKKFNNLKHEYELTLGNDCEIEAVNDDKAILQQAFAFVPISKLLELDPETVVDVIGVVKTVQPLATIMSNKSKKEVTKRSISLLDDSGKAVDVTLWGEEAQKHTEHTLANSPVVAFKRVRVSDFGGRSINSTFSTSVYVNPDIPEAFKLRNWYDTQGKAADVQSISTRGGGAGGAGGNASRRILLSQIKDDSLGVSDKGDYFTVRASVTFFKHDTERPPWYNACPKNGCNKKVTDDGNGQYTCASCNRSYPTFECRYILSFLVSDATGQSWISAFNEQAEQLVGKKAAELAAMLPGDTATYETVFKKASWKQYSFTCRAKSEMVQDEARVKCTLLRAEPVSYVKESAYLLEQIAKFD